MLYAVVAQRWRDTRIAAAASYVYVYFHDLLFIVANILLCFLTNYISFLLL